MATGGVAQKSVSSDGNTVRLFVTAYTDDFFAERELLKKEVILTYSCYKSLLEPIVFVLVDANMISTVFKVKSLDTLTPYHTYSRSSTC